MTITATAPSADISTRRRRLCIALTGAPLTFTMPAAIANAALRSNPTRGAGFIDFHRAKTPPLQRSRIQSDTAFRQEPDATDGSVLCYNCTNHDFDQVLSVPTGPHPGAGTSL